MDDKTTINWFPGHVKKTMDMVKEQLKLVDLVIEILDARIPISSKNPEIEKLIKNKKRIILLNKMDLVDRISAEKWENYFIENDLADNIIPVSVEKGTNIRELNKIISSMYKEKLEKVKKKGLIKTEIRAMVIGIPNVGKSKFINRISKKVKAAVGNLPGFTRGKKWITVDDTFSLLDTPGILWPKFDSKKVAVNLAITGSIKDNVLDLEEICLNLLQKMKEQNILENIFLAYNLEFEDVDFHNLMKKIEKRLLIHNEKEYDYEKISTRILKDYRQGKLGKFALELPEREKMIKFEELGLSEGTLKAIKEKGFEYATEIQSQVIPELLKERTHLIGQAQTGTGKTAAFGLPIIELLEPTRVVKAIILTPTRELASQVSEEIYSLKGDKDIKILSVYGGASIENQIKNLKRGVDIVVGTPGRVMDMMRKKALKLENLEFFILDEADEMLNMGFIDDVKEILKSTNDQKKMLFFSATMPKEILNIAKEFMPSFKKIKIEKKELTTNLTKQIYFEVRPDDKFEALCRVLDLRSDFYGIVFTKTKQDADDVTKKLKARGYSAECIHGDISQANREKTLDLFKQKILTVLVATDVAARGIDVSDLTRVINYSIPQEPESYVHRIGRTGRAGKKGLAITFVTPKEVNKLLQIQRLTKSEISKEKVPNIEQIIESKKENLIASIEEIMIENDYTNYLDFARTIIKNRNVDAVVASLLRHFYDDEFVKETYSEIKDITSKVDDKTRLFIALGKKDGMTPSKLLELLNKKANVAGRKVKDIKIMDKFSFITVPYAEAEYIMKGLNKNLKNKKPLAEISTGKKK